MDTPEIDYQRPFFTNDFTRKKCDACSKFNWTQNHHLDNYGEAPHLESLYNDK